MQGSEREVKWKWKHTWIVEAILQYLADYTGWVILDSERSFVFEVVFCTEGYGGVLLQPDEAGQLWSVGCCSNLKGNECH